jgi:CubicO group peptidase (beta-lactamase class C family)
MKRFRPAAVLLLAAAAVAAAYPSAAQAPAGTAASVDSVFARFTRPGSPGCAVGVSRDGRTELARAYGLAHLEHGVPNAPATVFEAGSVAKQFTAAAVVLLAAEGRLGLDDHVRVHLPEVPDHGATITVRHLLNHTSGLRDWGSVAALGGWPRGKRVHDHGHVLDIVARQTALNHAPGEHYSYTNTGYNLLVVLVERVAGESFAEFTRTRLFEPLGMADTQWRDDHTRVVPGRAAAYQPAPGGGYRLQMPFEDVHGNGGLLTTVGDLLAWTENLRTGRVGGPELVRLMHERGRLTGGREIPYAAGIVVGARGGVPEVSHSGATGGYRAWLARYPGSEVAVAVLCNAADAGVVGLGHAVADLHLPRGASAPPAAPAAAGREAAPASPVSAEALGARAGTYRDVRMHDAVRLVVEDGALRLDGGPVLLPVAEGRFRTAAGTEVRFDDPRAPGGRAGFRMVLTDGDTLRYVPEPEFTPTTEQLRAYAGTYRSADAEAVWEVAVDAEGRLAVRPRFGEPVLLTPVYPDAFESRIGTLRFLRDGAGRVTELSVVSPRVWDLRFQRER